MTRSARVALLVASLAYAVLPGHADSNDTLRRAGLYVRQFEQNFAAVITDEAYDQDVQRIAPGESDTAARRQPAREHRHMRSEMLFMRLPGQGLSWLTARNVLEVDGREVPDSSERLNQAIKGTDTGLIERLRSVADEGARFNLGGVRRNINDPNLALLFFDPDHQPRFKFRLEGEEWIDGARTERVSFKETARPTVIHQITGRNLPTKGAAWIRAEDGAILQTEVSGSADDRLDFTMRVQYRRDPKLEMWIPVRMFEHYRAGAAHEQVDCVAVYSNPRRFETFGRVVR
jgi:hypothetical protein